MGIEPTLSAWEAEVLPLNYTRQDHFFVVIERRRPVRSGRPRGRRRLHEARIDTRTTKGSPGWAAEHVHAPPIPDNKMSLLHPPSHVRSRTISYRGFCPRVIEATCPRPRCGHSSLRHLQRLDAVEALSDSGLPDSTRSRRSSTRTSRTSIPCTSERRSRTSLRNGSTAPVTAQCTPPISTPAATSTVPTTVTMSFQQLMRWSLACPYHEPRQIGDYRLRPVDIRQELSSDRLPDILDSAQALLVAYCPMAQATSASRRLFSRDSMPRQTG